MSLTATAYANRAAQKYLDAYARQEGRAYSVACGMTYAANMLNKAAHALALTLPGEDTDWWGERYRMLALAIITDGKGQS